MSLNRDPDCSSPASRPARLATPIILGYWLAMFVGTHLPNPELLIGPVVSEKALHFGAYFVLAGLLSIRTQLRQRAFRRASAVRIVLLLTTYAAIDELLQGLPQINRHADWWDGVADITGAISACLLMSLWSHWAARDR